jgi:cytochrome oxidase Cu insertion factor (SCO1/SenC/PrrC family)
MGIWVEFMKRGVALAIAALLLALGAVRSADAQQAQVQARYHGDYFPNIVLQDQDGRSVRFYDDMIRGKVVAINFVYTTCTDICPLDTAQLRRVQHLLGDRLGRDIFMYSISINGDTPEALRRFMRTYDVGPNWRFLTGSQADVTRLQRLLGLRVADPNDLRGHNTSIVIGNERTAQWIRRSAYENPQNLVELLTVAMQNHAPNVSRTSQSYAVAGEVTDNTRGAYLFRTRCQSCHTIGEGDRLGPDLAGVADTRPASWLSRWIREPDRMIAERDPVAIGMMARYRNLPMPNLSLGEPEIADIIAYMRGEDARRTAAHAGH